MNSEQWPGGQRQALTASGNDRRQELPPDTPEGFIESQQGELGEVRIANDVVSTIAGLAAVEVEGVAGMAGGIAGGISEILGRRNLSRGVRVEVGEHQAAIDLFIIVHYGVRIPEVAWRVQENVKRQIETMTGLEVTEVNVHIQGVQLPQAERTEESRVR